MKPSQDIEESWNPFTKCKQCFAPSFGAEFCEEHEKMAKWRKSGARFFSRLSPDISNQTDK